MLKLNSLHLQRGNKVICQSLDLEFKAGEFWCLVGPNGSGKSSFIQALAGLLPINSGSINLQGTTLNKVAYKQRAQQIGLLQQDSETCLVSTVNDCMQAARYPHHCSKEVDKQIIEQALQHLDLTEFKNRKATALSGGEQQRLQIAMLLAQNPAIYLLDEPTNHLDLNYQIKTLQLLKQLAKQENKLIIAAIHDINLAYQYANHACLFFEGGEIKSGKICEIFTESNLSLLYTLPLIKIKTELQSFWTCNPA
jgi:iron complex transport system ATP-binding protein